MEEIKSKLSHGVYKVRAAFDINLRDPWHEGEPFFFGALAATISSTGIARALAGWGWIVVVPPPPVPINVVLAPLVGIDAATTALLSTGIVAGIAAWVGIGLRASGREDLVAAKLATAATGFQLALSAAALGTFLGRVTYPTQPWQWSNGFFAIVESCGAGLFALIAFCIDLFYLGVPTRSVTVARRKLLFASLAAMSYLIIMAIIFERIEPHWDFQVSFTWTVFTALTIGYGEFSTTTNAGRILLFFLGPIAIGLIGFLLFTIRDNLLESARDHIKRVAVGRRLSVALGEARWDAVGGEGEEEMEDTRSRSVADENGDLERDIDAANQAVIHVNDEPFHDESEEGRTSPVPVISEASSPSLPPSPSSATLAVAAQRRASEADAPRRRASASDVPQSPTSDRLDSPIFPTLGGRKLNGAYPNNIVTSSNNPTLSRLARDDTASTTSLGSRGSLRMVEAKTPTIARSPDRQFIPASTPAASSDFNLGSGVKFVDDDVDLDDMVDDDRASTASLRSNEPDPDPPPESPVEISPVRRGRTTSRSREEGEDTRTWESAGPPRVAFGRSLSERPPAWRTPPALAGDEEVSATSSSWAVRTAPTRGLRNRQADAWSTAAGSVGEMEEERPAGPVSILASSGHQPPAASLTFTRNPLRLAVPDEPYLRSTSPAPSRLSAVNSFNLPKEGLGVGIPLRHFVTAPPEAFGNGRSKERDLDPITAVGLDVGMRRTSSESFMSPVTLRIALPQGHLGAGVPMTGTLSRTLTVDPARLFTPAEARALRRRIEIWSVARIGVVFMAYWFIGAAIFLALEQWTYLEALYFCWSTLTTTGYGDVVPVTPAAWEFWMWWAYAVVGRGGVGEIANDRSSSTIPLPSISCDIYHLTLLLVISVSAAQRTQVRLPGGRLVW